MDKLKLFSLAPESVTLENGQTVYLRRITGAERLAWFESLPDAVDGDTPAANPFASALANEERLLCMCLVDDQGKRIFDSANDVRETIDAVILDDLFKRAMKLNRLGADDEDTKKKPEPANAETTSSVSSPAPSGPNPSPPC